MSSNPSASASVGTTHTQETNVPSPPNNKKYSTVVDLEGAKGRDAAKWTSRYGVLIRAQIPIGYEEWRQVDDFYKDNLWNELVVLIEAAKRQKLQASLNGSNGITSLEEFESDPIAEVFGSEKKKSYCRAISSTSSLKQVKMTQATKAIASQRDVQDLRLWKMELQNQVTDAINSMTSAFINMQQNMMQNMNMQPNQFGGNMTPRTEVASNTGQTPAGHDIHDDNVAILVVSTNVGLSSKGKKYVMLLSRNLKEEMAKGYLATHTICHQREVLQDLENVVWVTKAIDPEALIFDGPQNENYKLCDIADGGFVIWPKYRLRNM